MITPENKRRIASRSFPVLIVFCLCFLAALTPALAQTGKISLTSLEMGIKQAMGHIESQTDYTIAVNWDDLDPGMKVTFASSTLEVHEVLKISLAGTEFSWEVRGKQIIIVHVAEDDGKNARSTIDSELKSSELVFVSDRWSRTQQPFDGMFDTGKISWNGPDGESAGMAVINFRVNSSVVEKDYMDNARTLEMIHRALTNRKVLAGLDHIIVTAASSPEGNTAANEKLAANRALAMKSYIMWKYPFMDRDIIYTFSAGENWSGLRRMVEEDSKTPYRDDVLKILDSDISTESKKSAIMSLGAGKAHRYISANMLPKLRGAAAATLHLKDDSAKVIERIDTVYIEKVNEIVIEREREVVVTREPELERQPLFAVKTNLLFDAASAINVEVEVPIGKRWSVAGEWVFPWWLYEKKQYALQVGNGNLEVKYWLGERKGAKQLTGWFLGLYGGGGYYDLEWKDKGYQGEFWHAGVSGGYAHTISRSGDWRMEYSLGLGYLGSDYRKYIPVMGVDNEWHLIRQHSGHRDWFGPTRAKVSLVWMLNHGWQEKGGKR